MPIFPLLTALACGLRTPGPERPDLLLVTLDTTRADAIGAYGGPQGISPHFDAVAAAGARFDMALAHAPTTASSHASMFTGLDPHGHEVPYNGMPLESRMITVAERLQELGYDTLAVVAASPVGAGSGLEQGFRRLVARYDTERERRYDARGDTVTREALALVADREPERPLFLWVHYYDAHSPYEPPDPFAAPFVQAGYSPGYPMAGPEGGPGFGELVRNGSASEQDMAHYQGLYHGEVAWQDHQLGQLLQGLGEQELLDDAWVLVAGDHGEMFYEERLRPMGHGPDIDLVISRVPLAIRGYGPKALGPQVVDQAVQLSDLGPTLLALAGSEGGLGTGRDLGPALRGQALQPVPIYLEATRPSSLEGDPRWNNIRAERGVAWKDHLLIKAPWVYERERLYSLEPGQSRVRDAELSAELGALLETWDAKAPGRRNESISKQLKQALEALGYLE